MLRATQGIPAGQLTSVIYGWIRDHRYGEAVPLLERQLQASGASRPGMSRDGPSLHRHARPTHDSTTPQALPDNRAALSLLGHCYYQAGSFEQAVRAYGRLTTLFPACPEYRLAFVQSLYKVTAARNVTRRAPRSLAHA